jgi:hypothetical protein
MIRNNAGGYGTVWMSEQGLFCSFPAHPTVESWLVPYNTYSFAPILLLEDPPFSLTEFSV